MTPNRKNETLDWFLYREKFYNSRDQATEFIENSKVIINGKIVTSIKYVPKTNDRFELVDYLNKNCSLKFIVAND